MLYTFNIYVYMLCFIYLCLCIILRMLLGIEKLQLLGITAGQAPGNVLLKFCFALHAAQGCIAATDDNSRYKKTRYKSCQWTCII